MARGGAKAALGGARAALVSSTAKRASAPRAVVGVGGGGLDAAEPLAAARRAAESEPFR